MQRLFVAIEIPEDVRARMAGLCAGLPGARWVAPENMHLTLRFIGEVDEGVMQDVDAELARLRAPGFALTFSGVDCFGNARRPRSLWVGVEAGEALAGLQARVESAVQRAGLPPEGRNFTPHVTLARFKGGRVARLGDYLSAHSQFRAGPVDVRRITLFSSVLGHNGAIYRPEAAYPLD